MVKIMSPDPRRDTEEATWENWKVHIIRTLEEYDRRISSNTVNYQTCSTDTRVEIAKLNIKAAVIGGVVGSVFGGIISLVGAMIIFHIKGG
jgi:hypothetical protein